MSKFEKVIELCKRRGILFQSAEIYGGLAGFFEYGPIGKRIFDKLIRSWKKNVAEIEDAKMFEIYGSVVLPYIVFKASGHVDKFTDPVTRCKKCNTVFRADHLIEDVLGINVEGKSIEEMTKIIRDNNIRCPRCNGELTKVKEFNLMFKLQIGPLEGNIGYLRPETAQNIFIDFKKIVSSYKARLPFGIYQIGLAFRNEISPRNFVIRSRGFHQAEIEFFFDPENDSCPIEKYYNIRIPIYTQEEQRKNSNRVQIKTLKEWLEEGRIKSRWLAYFMARQLLWFTEILGIPLEKLRFREQLDEERAFYSKETFDLEYYFEDIGWKEIYGNAYRTDYDLSVHMKYSKQDLSYVKEDGKKIVPHVAEPSMGIERTILMLLYEHYKEENGRVVLSLPEEIAPYKFLVVPLVNKDGLPEKAKEIYKYLREKYWEDIVYEEFNRIGKAYRWADEIGIPYVITIDYQTLEDDTVTVRNRDTKEQIRLDFREIPNKF